MSDLEDPVAAWDRLFPDDPLPEDLGDRYRFLAARRARLDRDADLARADRDRINDEIEFLNSLEGIDPDDYTAAQAARFGRIAARYEAPAPRRRRHPKALTPSEACDMHIDLATWFRSDIGREYVEAFNGADHQLAPGEGRPLEQSASSEFLISAVDRADTFYVTAEMQQIAMEAAVDLDGMPLFRHDLPSQSSTMILFDTSAGYTYDFGLDREQVELRGLLLIPITTVRSQDGTSGPGCMFVVFYDLDDMIAKQSRYVDHQATTGPMLYGDWTSWRFDLPWSPETIGDALLAEHRRFWMSLLLLMQEERYTERERPERATRKRWQRASLNVPDDLCVSVTRLRRPHRRSEPGDGNGDARYSHQWVVRGHWRRIHKGTDDERAVFVHPYIKGPEGAPFVQKRKLSRLEK